MRTNVRKSHRQLQEEAAENLRTKAKNNVSGPGFHFVKFGSEFECESSFMRTPNFENHFVMHEHLLSHENQTRPKVEDHIDFMLDLLAHRSA
jgi:hypothetical protein